MAAKKDQIVKRIDRVNEDLDAQWDAAHGRVYKTLQALGFGPEYCELAAADIADDHQNGLLEGEPPEIPLWHEPDWEPPEDDEDGPGEEDDEEDDEDEGGEVEGEAEA